MPNDSRHRGIKENGQANCRSQRDEKRRISSLLFDRKPIRLQYGLLKKNGLSTHFSYNILRLLTNRHKLGIQVHLDSHRRITQEH